MIRLSVCGVACREGLYLLLQRGPGGSQANKWEFPGGKAEGGETAPVALMREWDEELGVIVSVGKHLVSARFTHNAQNYELQAWEVSFAGPLGELREHRQAAWVAPSDLRGYDLSDSDRKVAEFLADRG